MRRTELLKLFLESNFNIASDALYYLEEKKISEEIIRKIISMVPQEIPVVSLDILLKLMESNEYSDTSSKIKSEDVIPFSLEQISNNSRKLNDKQLISKLKSVNQESESKLIVKDHKTPLTINITLEVPERIPDITDIDAFRKMFQNRYRELSRILVDNINNPEKLLKRKLSINEVPINKNGILVGMVQDTRVLHTNRFVIQLEDPITEINTNCVIVQDSLTFPDYRNILRDTVCAIEGILPKNYQEGEITAFWGKDIIRPSFKPIEFKPTVESYNLLFLSDLHIGSKYFAKNLFTRLIRLINRKHPESQYHEIVSEIDAIFIIGDLIDGVGHYSNQKEDLTLHSLQTQYEELAKLLSEIPSSIKIIIIPGEHDATISALPQTPIDKNLGENLLKLPNLRSYGNPLRFSIEDLKFLLFHGQGNDILFQRDFEMKQLKPAIVIQDLLEYRHLCPEYGSTIPLTPFKKDYLVISETPHVLISGHFHQAHFQDYRGVKIITCGSFLREKQKNGKLEDKTSLGVFPIFNTHMGSVTMLDLKKI